MLINKINCINNNQTFKGYYQRVQDLKDRSSWFDSDYWNAEEIIERHMRNEIYDIERQIAQKEAQLSSRENTERENKRSHASILSSKRARLSNIREQISYQERTVIPGINRTLNRLGSQNGQLSSANSAARSAISKQEADIANLKKEIEKLRTQCGELKESLRADLEKKIQALRIELDKKAAVIADNINGSIKKPEPLLREIYTPKPNGFGTIPGFEDVKKVITEKFGQLLVLEKNGKTVEVPNGVLLYGPDVENNSNFANAIAKQFNTPSIVISSEGNETERFNRIKAAGAKAKKNYEEGLGRTLIIINKFEEFAPKQSKMIGPLKSFLDDVSRDSHATVIATTSAPELLDDILFRSGRFESKIAIPAMTKNDILAAIKRYLPLELADSVDPIAASELLEKKKMGGNYTVGILKSFIKTLKNPNQIKYLLTNIRPEQIQKYKHYADYIKRIL